MTARGIGGLQALRVLIVGPYPVNESPIGGVESACAGLVAGLAARHDVAAVHVADFRPLEHARVDERPLDKVVVHRLRAQMRYRMVNWAERDRKALCRLVAEVGPDIVHGQGIGLVGYLATAVQRPSVVTVHGIAVREMANRSQGPVDRLRVRMLNAIASATVKRADAVVSISHYDQGEIECYRPRYNTVIPNAVPVMCAPSDPVSREVLFAGVLIPRKRVVETVEATAEVARRIDGVRLWVAGPSSDEDYRALVDDAISKAGGTATYVGALDRTRLSAMMSQVGVLVLFADQETLPVVVAEAMSCGRVVVAADVGGLSEMIDDGLDGILIPSGDGAALTAALETVLGDDETRVRMGRRAAVAGRKYSPEYVAARTIDVYTRVLCQ